MWGFRVAGLASSPLCSAKYATSGATWIPCAVVEVEIAIDGFNTQTKIKQKAVSGFVGGEEDGI